jgi:hypothetical protein
MYHFSNQQIYEASMHFVGCRRLSVKQIMDFSYFFSLILDLALFPHIKGET